MRERQKQKRGLSQALRWFFSAKMKPFKGAQSRDYRMALINDTDSHSIWAGRGVLCDHWISSLNLQLTDQKPWDLERLPNVTTLVVEVLGLESRTPDRHFVFRPLYRSSKQLYALLPKGKGQTTAATVLTRPCIWFPRMCGLMPGPHGTCSWGCHLQT